MNVSADSGDAVAGAAAWETLECMRCHGENAEGGAGALNVALAGTDLDFDDFVLKVRSGPADMRAYPPAEISNATLADVYAWLRSQTPQ